MDNDNKRKVLDSTNKSLSKGFFNKEDLNDVGGKIVSDIIVPKIKSSILSAVSIILYREDKTNPNSTTKSPNGFQIFEYNKQYQVPTAQTIKNNYMAGSKRPIFKDVLFTSPEEATAVWYQLHDILQRDGFLTLGQYYDKCQADITYVPAMENYGWRHIGDTPTILTQVNEGNTYYVIPMTPIRPLA